ncbi:conserved hypothetical protein [delta proteobacterium NaphS2]|nr:conserved hypothetical protein [delta proteobacterium NaphS2]
MKSKLSAISGRFLNVDDDECIGFGLILEEIRDDLMVIHDNLYP